MGDIQGLAEGPRTDKRGQQVVVSSGKRVLSEEMKCSGLFFKRIPPGAPRWLSRLGSDSWFRLGGLLGGAITPRWLQGQQEVGLESLSLCPSLHLLMLSLSISEINE